MKILILFFVLSFSLKAFTQVTGHIDSLTLNSSTREVTVSGWACDYGVNKSINIHVFFGGSAGQSSATLITAVMANNKNESAVNGACGTAASTTHRFSLRLAEKQWIAHDQKSVYIHGISTSGVGTKNLLIGNSGNFKLPSKTLLSQFTITNGGDLEIPANRSITIDRNLNLRNLTIRGELKCATNSNSYNFILKGLSVYGKFTCGNSSSSFNGKLDLKMRQGFQLTNSSGGMGERGIIVHDGGVINLFGNKSTNSIVKLSATANVGENKITLNSAVNWISGDEIVIASTGFNMNEAERKIIQSVSSDKRTITLTSNLSYQHYGMIDTYTKGASTFNLDKRATVATLNRNIKIYPYDAEGDSTKHADNKKGAHLMVMTGGRAYIDSAEFGSMGIQGEMGRYPMHWHMVGNADGQYIKNSVVKDSYQRCITIHATNNVLVQNNVCYNHFGHGFFLENGSEVGNTIKGNFALVAKKISKENSLLVSDTAQGAVARRFPTPSSYWISNPRNTVEDNIASGSEGSGFWMSFEDKQICNKDSCSTPIRENTTKFNRNIAHSSKVGITWDGAPGTQVLNNPNNIKDTALVSAHYRPTTKAVFDKLVAFRNTEAGIYFRGDAAKFTNTILADNAWSIFVAYSQHFQNSAVIGISKNMNATDMEAFQKIPGQAGVMIYDGPFELENVHFFNFPTSSSTLKNKPIPIDIMGGANRFLNKVKGLTFTPEPWSRLSLDGTNENWGDTNHSVSIWDFDGSLTGTANKLVVPMNNFNYYSNCKGKSEWAAYICNYKVGIITFRISGVGTNNNYVHFSTKRQSTGAIAASPKAGLFYNKFGVNLTNLDEVYEVTREGKFAEQKSFDIWFITEGKGSKSPLILLKNLGTSCRASGFNSIPESELRQNRKVGYKAIGNNLLIRLTADLTETQNAQSEMSKESVRTISKITCE